MPSVSYSEASAYLDCKKRHYFNYIENLEPNVSSAAMSDGKFGHKVLQTYYENRMAGQNHLFSVDMARGIFNRGVLEGEYKFDPDGKRADLEVMLFDYYFPNEPYAQQGWKILAVEREFVLRWDDGDTEGYKFIIDLIARNPQGEIAIIDHKFTGRFTTIDMGQMLPQIPLYIAGIRAQGLPADYGIYNEINMTKVQKRRTVAEALHQLPFRPSSSRVLETFRQQVEVSREINGIKQLPISVAGAQAWRSIDKIKCGMCSFQSLCMGELNGDNVNLIRRTDYKQRERKIFAMDEQ